jgi:hypothetical protein
MKLSFRVDYDVPEMDQYVNHTDEEKKALVFAALLAKVKATDPDRSKGVKVTLLKEKKK